MGVPVHHLKRNKNVGGIATVHTVMNKLMKPRPNTIFSNAGKVYQKTLC